MQLWGEGVTGPRKRWGNPDFESESILEHFEASKAWNCVKIDHKLHGGLKRTNTNNYFGVATSTAHFMHFIHEFE